MGEAADQRAEILEYLAREGLTFECRSADTYRVGPPHMFRSAPHFTVPPDLLDEYLRTMSKRYGDQPDPFREALSLTKIHAMEYLTTDHGGGRNATTALGFRRARSGEVEFFVEQGEPDYGPPPGNGETWEWRAARP